MLVCFMQSFIQRNMLTTAKWDFMEQLMIRKRQVQMFRQTEPSVFDNYISPHVFSPLLIHCKLYIFIHFATPTQLSELVHSQQMQVSVLSLTWMRPGFQDICPSNKQTNKKTEDVVSLQRCDSKCSDADACGAYRRSNTFLISIFHSHLTYSPISKKLCH